MAGCNVGARHERPTRDLIMRLRHSSTFFQRLPIYDLRSTTPRGSVLVALRMSGSRSFCDRETPRCSRSIHR